MSDVNKVEISGRLTKDALMKHTPGGKTVTELHLAVNNEASTIFVQVDCWGDEAGEIVGELEKGRRVVIFGRLKQILTGRGTRNAKKRLIIASDYILLVEDF